jgi:hypothetical protein
MSYIDLRGRWRTTIALNEHASNEEKNDGSKDNFPEQLKRVSKFQHID